MQQLVPFEAEVKTVVWIWTCRAGRNLPIVPVLGVQCCSSHACFPPFCCFFLSTINRELVLQEDTSNGTSFYDKSRCGGRDKRQGVRDKHDVSSSACCQPWCLAFETGPSMALPPPFQNPKGATKHSLEMNRCRLRWAHASIHTHVLDVIVALASEVLFW